MTDNMRFSQSDIQVKQGDSIKFIAKNDGKLNHEMVIGTMEVLKAHSEVMKKNPNMEHDDPHVAHVDPGRKEDMIWRFSKAGDFNFACLQPGHFEAGMIGKITVT